MNVEVLEGDIVGVDVGEHAIFGVVVENAGVAPDRHAAVARALRMIGELEAIDLHKAGRTQIEDAIDGESAKELRLGGAVRVVLPEDQGGGGGGACTCCTGGGGGGGAGCTIGAAGATF